MILVDVYVPCLDKTYDFNLEENAEVKVIIDEIAEMTGQMERTKIIGQTSLLQLCDRDRQMTLPKEEYLSACGVHNGSRLILV